MTENEAVHCLKVYTDETVCEECDFYQNCTHETQADMARLAIKALEEIQQYRAIGTVEECREMMECLKDKETYTKQILWERNIAIRQLEEIGVSLGEKMDSVKEAMERHRAKKSILCMNEQSGMLVDYADGHGEYKTQMNNWWRCPCCNEVVGQRVIAHKYIHDQRKKNFCEKCGQAIDWSDTD